MRGVPDSWGCPVILQVDVSCMRSSIAAARRPPRSRWRWRWRSRTDPGRTDEESSSRRLSGGGGDDPEVASEDEVVYVGGGDRAQGAGPAAACSTRCPDGGHRE